MATVTTSGRRVGAGRRRRPGSRRPSAAVGHARRTERVEVGARRAGHRDHGSAAGRPPMAAMSLTLATTRLPADVVERRRSDGRSGRPRRRRRRRAGGPVGGARRRRRRRSRPRRGGAGSRRRMRSMAANSPIGSDVASAADAGRDQVVRPGHAATAWSSATPTAPSTTSPPTRSTGSVFRMLRQGQRVDLRPRRRRPGHRGCGSAPRSTWARPGSPDRRASSRDADATDDRHGDVDR